MLALDHFVIAADNAAIASAQYSSQYSIKAIKGGEHDQWGTYNYLAYFSNNCYIEWIDISNFNIARKSSNPLIKHLVHLRENDETGLFQYAFRTNDLYKYINHFNKNNIPFEGPFKGERERPDGSILSWKMLFPTYDYKKEILPFLIEWDTPISERINPSLLNAQAIESIYFGAYNPKKFNNIYRLKFKSMYKNGIPLSNTKFHYSKEHKLKFTLV